VVLAGAGAHDPSMARLLGVDPASIRKNSSTMSVSLPQAVLYYSPPVRQLSAAYDRTRWHAPGRPVGGAISHLPIGGGGAGRGS